MKWPSRLVALLLLTHPSFAMEDLPEFESVTEEEVQQLEGPDRVGSEYQSDILSYMKPELWHYEWLSKPRLLDLSVGSLSATQFLMDTRLKIHAPLSPHFELRFTALDDRDFEKQSRQQIFEFVGWAKPWVGLSLYGNPDFSKRKNDTGVALLLRPSHRHEIRIFNTFVDVTRLKRSDAPDTFIEPDLPYARGIVGRIWSDREEGKKEFLQYAFRHETRTRWLFPVEGYVHSYQKTFGSLFFSKLLTPSLRLNARSQVDHKRESRTPGDDWTTRRWISHARVLISGLGPRSDWELTAGAMTALRWWKRSAGTSISHDLLPMLSLSLPGYSAGQRRDRWNFGVIETIRNSTEGDAEEFRFSLGYDFQFGDTATLRLQANGDLDEYGTPRAWEGGNAQLILNF